MHICILNFRISVCWERISIRFFRNKNCAILHHFFMTVWWTTDRAKSFGILLPKLFWPTVRKNCSSEFSKFLRSLEQFVCLFVSRVGSNLCRMNQIRICRNNLFKQWRSEQFLVTECFSNLFLEISQISKKKEQL